jgi:ketosteroid isomerase-like protein
MSEEAVRALREVIDAYNRGDQRAWRNLMDPELETFPTPDWPEPGPFIGPDAAWDFYTQFEETLALSEAYELTEVIDAGDSLIACQEAPMRGQASAAEVGFRLWGVHTLGDGRFIRTQWFSERSEALEAAGLSA